MTGRLPNKRERCGINSINYSLQKEIRNNGDLMKGKVKMFNVERGFGFITGDDGNDVYVHTSKIEGGMALSPGDSVEYEVEVGERGSRAKNVKKI